MERLTYVKGSHTWDRGAYPTKYTSRHTFQEVVARLAAYEDTGLEPEEITALQATCKAIKEEAMPLLWAKAEDRLVVLPPNAPLTLEELREMDGEPVWCRTEHRPEDAGWFLVCASAEKPHEFIAVGRERGIPCAGISSGYWEAYRRRPEEGSS